MKVMHYVSSGEGIIPCVLGEYDNIMDACNAHGLWDLYKGFQREFTPDGVNFWGYPIVDGTVTYVSASVQDAYATA